MRLFYVLLCGVSAPITVAESTILPTIAQLMENNGDTSMNIFVFCRDYQYSRFAMNELYSFCLENTVSPVVRDVFTMKMTYLKVNVFFRPVPKTFKYTSPLMGMDASIIFADEWGTDRDVLQFMWSRIRPQPSFSVEGTMLADALNREEV
jgi:hypothetical protein